MNSEAPCVSDSALSVFTSNPLVVEANGIPRMSVHGCDDGGSGIAVIIGFFPAEHVPTLRAALAEQAEAEAKRKERLASSN